MRFSTLAVAIVASTAVQAVEIEGRAPVGVLAEGLITRQTAANITSVSPSGQIRHYTGVIQYLSTIPPLIPQIVNANWAQYVPYAVTAIQTYAPGVKTIGDLSRAIPQVVAQFLPTLMAYIPVGVLDGPEYAAAFQNWGAVNSVLDSAASGVLGIFPSTLAITDLPNYVSAHLASIDTAAQSVVSSAIPAAQSLLSGLENVAYPSGVPADATGACTPGAVATTTGAIQTATASASTGGNGTSTSGSASTTSAHVVTGAAPALSAGNVVVGGALLSFGVIAVLL